MLQIAMSSAVQNAAVNEYPAAAQRRSQTGFPGLGFGQERRNALNSVSSVNKGLGKKGRYSLGFLVQPKIQMPRPT